MLSLSVDCEMSGSMITESTFFHTILRKIRLQVYQFLEKPRYFGHLRKILFDKFIHSEKGKVPSLSGLVAV